EECRPCGDVCEAAELLRDAESPDGVSVPVGEQRKAQVEHLRPRDVRPGRVAGDAEESDSPLREFRAPVTQELHLVRSGRRPVEEVEEEERTPVGNELA